MACITCSSFDPNYKDGWCDYHKCKTNPYSSCNLEDTKGGGFKDHTCSTCYWFDSSYHGGYCDKHKKDTYASSSCSSWVK